MNIPTKIKIQAGVRYWVDCKYSTDNGVTWIEQDDTDENDLLVRKVIPCVEFLDEEQNWYWCLVIDFETGKIENWKKDFCINTFFKVCDDGRYQIIGDNDNVLWDSDDANRPYVPEFLEINSSNCGDNIYITIDGDGTIKDWDIAKDRILNLIDNAEGE